MPSPKTVAHSELIPINLTNTAFAGLNTEQSGAIIDKAWATVLDNAVFDSAGRPSARKGFDTVTSSPPSGEAIRRIFEYYQSDGTSELITSTDDDILAGKSGIPTSVDGTLTITDGNIKFVNFNDRVIGFGIGTGGIPAVRTTGNFADIAVNSGTAPTGRIGTAAFGRLWVFDADGKTLRYSALLDETRWAVADGGGLIDFSNIWPAGQDSAVAVEEFGGELVVFGSNNIVVLTDGQGASLGIDPLALYVSDTIPGQGAISQFAIARVNGDLWVLTDSGLFSLGREIIQKSTPLTNISRNVQSLIIEFTKKQTSADDITVMYSPRHSMVVAVFPDSSKCVMFDTRTELEQGAYRAATWTSDIITLAYCREDDEIYGSHDAAIPLVQYGAANDDAGEPFIFDYESGWLDLQQLNTSLKSVKNVTSFVFTGSSSLVVSHKISYDFDATSFVQQKQIGGGRVIEWGNFEWGSNGLYSLTDSDAVAGTDYAEWSNGNRLRQVRTSGQGTGQYIKLGLAVKGSSGDFSMQQINLHAKIGRLA